MFQFTNSQQKKALIWIAFWHIIIIALSNFLVQFPFTIWGFHSTWGALTFPFTFLTTDLTVRVFGARLARKIIFVVMLPALLISYAISIAFYHSSDMQSYAMLDVNWFVARIALASFAAYLVGQLLDVKVFNYLRHHHRWWVAPTMSTFFGNAIDTLIFFVIAFWRSNDEFMSSHWPEIALLDYGFKLIISALFFLPIYGVLLKWLSKQLSLLGIREIRLEKTQSI